MRPATTLAIEVANGWQALDVLRAKIAGYDVNALATLNKSEHRSPAEIHAFVKHRVRYVHGRVQRWATPERTLTAGFGDCGNSSWAIMALASFHGYPSRLRVFTRTVKEPGLIGRSRTSPAHVSAQIQDPATGRWMWTEAAIDAHYGEHTLAAAKRLGVPTSLKEVPVRMPSIAGPWLLRGYPPVVRVAGHVFKKTRWAWPYKGVVAQYREARPVGSAHMMVTRQGTWRIDHADHVNPDRGALSAVAHLGRDVLPLLTRGRGVGSIGDVSSAVPSTKTPVSVPDMWTAMGSVWASRSGVMPSAEQLQVLMAQWMLETGNGASMIQWNVGNFKHVPGDGWNYTTYGTTECDPDTGDNCAAEQGSFAAYPDLATGLGVYFDGFYSGKWSVAWPALLAGDVTSFATAIRSKGYFTASLASYIAGMNARIQQLAALDLGAPGLPISQLPNLIAILALFGVGLYGAQYMGLIDLGPPLDWSKLGELARYLP